MKTSALIVYACAIALQLIVSFNAALATVAGTQTPPPCSGDGTQGPGGPPKQ